MAFIITASDPVGALSFDRDDSKGAIEKALEMVAEGYSVSILDTSDSSKYSLNDISDLVQKYPANNA